MGFSKNKSEDMKRIWERIKVLVLLVMTLFIVRSSHAQSFSEWFKQKKTQKKYLLAQIAALEAYMMQIEKGYELTKSGLSAVSKFKEGSFLQHALHFQSMEMVSPKVKGYSKVLAIAEMEDKSEKFRRKLLARADLDSFLNRGELSVLRQKFNAADIEADKDLNGLEILVSDGTLKMTDDERITHIDRLYLEVQKRCKTIYRFGYNIQRLLASRRRRNRDIRVLGGLYGR